MILTSKWYLLFLLFISIVYGDTNKDEPLVTVNEGKLQGSVERLLDGSPYYSFKGIPYARPPVGELRFTAPQPPQAWQGTYDATKHGSVCPQFDLISGQVIEGDENCLFLNVYTKTLNPHSKTPVMVFIHGGAYMTGSGNVDNYLGPEFLLQHDVTFVTMNYRLEVLGFLSLETPEVPGNAGMKDQVAALQWVKNNIRKFGGDPDNVTLFGESAGASSVTYHMSSPMSKGLFQKAVAQSGVSVADWAIGKSPKDRAFRAGKVLGKETNDTTELLTFLRSVPATDLVQMTFKTLTEDEKHRGLKEHFVPVIEKQFKNVDPFLTNKPIDLILENKMNEVPLMIGYNSAEGLINLVEQLNASDFNNKNPQYLVPREISEKVTEQKVKELGERIKKFYVGNSDFSNETAVALVNIVSDLHFVYSIHRFAHFYSIKHKPIYMYRFNFDTGLNFFKQYFMFPHMEGACHGDDLFYLFFSKLSENFYKSQEKLRDIVYEVTKIWTDFAKTSNPTPGNSSVKWPKYETDSKAFLNLDETSAVGKFAEKDRVEFWDQIYCEVGLPCISQSNQQ